MPSSHIVFIPFIFLLGYFAGISQRRTQGGRIASSAGPAPRVSGRQLAAVLLVLVAGFAATHLMPLPGGANALHTSLGHQALFDQSPASSADEVYSRLQSYGEAGRQAYARFTYTGDVAFPAVLLAFLLVMARFVFERAMPTRKLRILLLLVPVLWVVSDALENATIYRLILEYPTHNDFLAEALGAVTRTKFGLLLASLIFPIAQLATYWWREQR